MKNTHNTIRNAIAICVAGMLVPSIAEADIDEGLSAYYAFENSDELGNDSSTNGSDLTPYTDGEENNLSGVEGTEGLKGKAAFFNPDVFTLGLLQNDGGSIADTTGDFTWSMWFKMNPEDTNDFAGFGLMSKGPEQVGEVEEDFIIGAKGLILSSDGTLVFDVFDIDLMEFDGDLVDGLWHHVVVTNTVFEEEGEELAFFTLYVDGVEVSDLELPVEDLEEAEGSKLRIGSGIPGNLFLEGAWPFDDGETSPTFIGAIDEVRVYDRAVSEEEVLELLFDANPTPAAAEFASQPIGGKAVLGRPYMIWAEAKGLLLEYQWFKGDSEIEGADGLILEFEEISLDDAGDYKVVVTNPGGEVTSSIATLEVLEEWDPAVGLIGYWSFEDADNLGKDGSGNDVDLTDNGVFQTEGAKGKAIETGDGAYLRDDSELLPLDTLQSFTWTVMVKADGTQGNIIGKSDDEWSPGNKGMFIRDDALGFDVGWIGDVGGGPEINDNEWHHLAFRSERIDGEYFLSVFVDGNLVGEGDMLLDYQPDSGVFAIGFASNDFPEFEEQETSNLIGSIDEVRVYNLPLLDEDIFTLFTEDGGTFKPAEIVEHPEDEEVIEGRTARFSVEATGTMVTFQWQKDGVDIPDATDSELRITNVSKEDAGEYRVVASSEFAGNPVTSDPATLTVNDAPNFGGGELAHVAPFLESYWNFDEMVDGLVPDLSPLLPSHHGELMLGAALTSGGQGFGGSGEALNTLDGELNAHMAAMAPEAYDFDSAFTWTARVKVKEPAAAGDEQGAGLFGRTPGEAGHAAGAKIMFLNELSLGFDQGWVGAFGTDNELELDTWHQVTFVYQPEEDVALISIYLDDEPVIIEGEEAIEFEFELSEFPETDDPPAEGAPQAVNSGFRIGSGANPVEEPFFSDPFPGLIDDVAVWSTALSPEDIELLANGASPLPEVIDGEDPEIRIAREGDSISITYTGVLMFAPSLGEDFVPVDGAASPHSVTQEGFYISRSE